MSFVLLVCSEIVGEKVNLEFPFAQKPPVGELYETVERVFRFETSNSSRAHTLGQQLYTVSKVQVYSDDARLWVDLTSSGQLHAYDQLYVFPRGARIETDSARRELPRPRSSLYFAAKIGNTTANAVEPQQESGSGAAAPPPLPSSGSGVQPSSQPHLPAQGERSLSNGRQPSQAATYAYGQQQQPLDAMHPPPLTRPGGGGAYSSQPTTPRGGPAASTNQSSYYSQPYGGDRNGGGGSAGLLDNVSSHEQVRICFEHADRRRNGFINGHDFFDLFRAFNIRFSKDLCDEMFTSSNANRDTMNFHDFAEWATMYPSGLATLFSRLQAKDRGEHLREAQKQNDEVIGDLTRQKEKLELALKRLTEDLRREHMRAEGIVENLRLIDVQLLEEDEEESMLLEKEIRVQQRRMQLKRDEEDLQFLTKKRRELHQSRTPSVASSSYGGYDRR